MKPKNLFLFTATFVALFVLSGCAAAQGFVALPDETKIRITALVVSLVALLFNFAIARAPWLEFFRKYQAEWSLSLAVALIAAIEYALPDQFADIAAKGIDFLLAVILLYVPFMLARNFLVKRGSQGFAKSK